MRPWMTNMQSVARDAHEHIFASTGALAFANEHSGSAAPPAPYNAIERKLFMMKAFHHPDGSQKAFLTGLAHLYNLVPYQRRAQHAGQCGVEVEGGKVPTRDWFLNLQILTSGGFR